MQLFVPGLHVRVWRGLYWHHAITVGFDDSGVPWLIEAGTPSSPHNIRWVTLADFSRGQPVLPVTHANTFSRSEIAQRAVRSLGPNTYSVFSNNCEHFATWCATGRRESGQAQLLGAGCAVGLLAFLGACSRGGLRAA